MSIIESLKRLFDPIEYRQQKREQRRKAQAPRTDENPDLPPRPPQPTVCRVCGFEGTGRFCPSCLAETMVKRK